MCTGASEALRFSERLGEWEGKEYIEVPAVVLALSPLPASSGWEEECRVLRQPDWFTKEGAWQLAKEDAGGDGGERGTGEDYMMNEDRCRRLMLNGGLKAVIFAQTVLDIEPHNLPARLAMRVLCGEGCEEFPQRSFPVEGRTRAIEATFSIRLTPEEAERLQGLIDGRGTMRYAHSVAEEGMLEMPWGDKRDCLGLLGCLLAPLAERLRLGEKS